MYIGRDVLWITWKSIQVVRDRELKFLTVVITAQYMEKEIDLVNI